MDIANRNNAPIFEDADGTVGYTIDALQSCDGRSKRRRDSLRAEEVNSSGFR